ncbi:RNA-directed DNA polymerase, eukaryota [Tanacetum coccineum]
MPFIKSFPVQSVAFICKVRIDNIRTRKWWNYPSCGGEKCKKGVTGKLGGWWCNSCNQSVEYPVLRFRLELGLSDQMGHVVVIMFNETAYELVKCSADSIAHAEEESFDDVMSLPPALTNVIGSTHTLELKSHTCYEHETVESFTCWKMHPTKTTEESAVLMVDSITFGQEMVNILVSGEAYDKAFNHLDMLHAPLMGKVLILTTAKHPSVSTPLKPSEEKKSRREDLEDSDAKLSPSLSEGKHEDKVGYHSDRKKKKQLVYAAYFFHGKRRFALLKNPRLAALASAGVPISYHNLGPPSYQCSNSHANMWYEERTDKARKVVNPTFSNCCQDSKVRLSIFHEPPPPLNKLLDYTDHVPSRLLLPKQGAQPRYAQLYFFDTENEVRNQMSAFINKEMAKGVDPSIVQRLIEMLNQSSSVAKETKRHRYAVSSLMDMAYWMSEQQSSNVFI